jgi:hypothetical protein
MLQKIKNKKFLSVSAGVMTALVPAFAFASTSSGTTIDWGAQFSGIESQAIAGITAMLPIGVTILGIMTAVSLGVKMYHKLSGTRS